jgi:lipopolysaccharide transport system ATP-binding protein
MNAIEAVGLWKQYRLGARRDRYPTVRESIARGAARFAKSLSARRRSNRTAAQAKEFWALQDVSFDVRRGETVGVIGHNGAGKSTLLRVLSRIAEPTAGHALIRGRVASLLEVGTGFHPELTGRENVFLNGAILGMSKRDIARRFDEIVAFADVDRFVDTQVKHYSSGMGLRLAFAVAAHLEPEILLVDEVLAVGDAAFQRKCLGKMEDVATGGRTVLFVSHNLGAVKELCQTSLVLNNGRVVFRGSAVAGISHYTRDLLTEHATGVAGEGWSHLTSPLQHGEAGWITTPSEPFSFSAHLTLREEIRNGRVFLLLHDASGALVVHNRIDVASLGGDPLAASTHCFTVAVPTLWLAPGLYALHLKFIGQTASSGTIKHVSERQLLDLRGWTESNGKGLLSPACRWELQGAISGGA